MDARDIPASLSKPRTDRWRALVALASEWFGPITTEPGYPEEAIRAAEARLGVALPAALREAYLLFGRKIELACVLDPMWPPHWLEMRDGLLVFAAMRDEWGIAASDLAMEDPPVIRRDDSGRSRPVSKRDASLSRFLVIEALIHAAEAGRYTNRAPHWPISATNAALSRVATRVDVEAASPLHCAARYIVSLHKGTGALRLSAPDLESYRAAVAALGGIDWAWTEREARRGAFLVRAERWEAFFARFDEMTATIRQMVFGAQKSVAAHRAAPARPAPLDPRLAELVTRAFRPYEGLLPPAAAAFFVEAAGFALDAHPTLDAWTNAFLGKPRADDIARPHREPDASFQALLDELSPEEREIAESYLAAGVTDRMRAWAGPRYGASGALAQGSGVDYVLLERSEQAMQRFVGNVPPRPPADRSACERELFHTVRLMMASLLAGVVAELPMLAAAGFAKPCESYRRAVEAFACFEGDTTVWRAYYGSMGREMRGVRDRLGVSEDEAYERLRAFLEGLATTIESSEDVVALRGAGPGAQ